jgi:hypothetical protein
MGAASHPLMCANYNRKNGTKYKHGMQYLISRPLLGGGHTYTSHTYSTNKQLLEVNSFFDFIQGDNEAAKEGSQSVMPHANPRDT